MPHPLAGMRGNVSYLFPYAMNEKDNVVFTVFTYLFHSFTAEGAKPGIKREELNVWHRICLCSRIARVFLFGRFVEQCSDKTKHHRVKIKTAGHFLKRKGDDSRISGHQ